MRGKDRRDVEARRRHLHDLGLCPACERGTNELHTWDCPLAIEQDHLDGDHSGCDHDRLDPDEDGYYEGDIY